MRPAHTVRPVEIRDQKCDLTACQLDLDIDGLSLDSVSREHGDLCDHSQPLCPAP